MWLNRMRKYYKIYYNIHYKILYKYFYPKSKETIVFFFSWSDCLTINNLFTVALFYLKSTTFSLHNEKERQKVNVDESYVEIL